VFRFDNVLPDLEPVVYIDQSRLRIAETVGVEQRRHQLAHVRSPDAPNNTITQGPAAWPACTGSLSTFSAA